jgi:hypothetical protein
MIDINGREVVRKVIAPAGAYTFDVTAMPAGMYINSPPIPAESPKFVLPPKPPHHAPRF